MYKVFIENKPINFHFNSQSDSSLKPVDSEKIWREIEGFLTNDSESELDIELKSEDDFFSVFKEHKYIEAAGGVVQRDASFLFIKRNGLWDIPKGKLEKGESPEAGAIREIEEECGLVKPIIKDHLINTWHTYPHKKRIVLKKTYWFWLDEGEDKVDLVPQGEEGITEVNYFERARFNEIKENTYQSIIDVMDILEKKID